MAYHTMVHKYPNWGEKKDWATPQYFFDNLNARFNFDLDAAANSSNHKCEKWFGLDNPNEYMRDALTANWMDYAQSAIWCNPPYGREIKSFLLKGESCTLPVVYLLPNSTDTRWFHDIALKHKIEFVKGRLKFGEGKTPASFGSILVMMNV